MGGREEHGNLQTQPKWMWAVPKQFGDTDLGCLRGRRWQNKAGNIAASLVGVTASAWGVWEGLKAKPSLWGTQAGSRPPEQPPPGSGQWGRVFPPSLPSGRQCPKGHEVGRIRAPQAGLWLALSRGCALEGSFPASACHSSAGADRSLARRSQLLETRAVNKCARP